MNCYSSLCKAIVTQRNNIIAFSTGPHNERDVLGGKAKFRKVNLLVKLRIDKCCGEAVANKR